MSLCVRLRVDRVFSAAIVLWSVGRLGSLSYYLPLTLPISSSESFPLTPSTLLSPIVAMYKKSFISCLLSVHLSLISTYTYAFTIFMYVRVRVVSGLVLSMKFLLICRLRELCGSE